jgi:hypothetical protein
MSAQQSNRLVVHLFVMLLRSLEVYRPRMRTRECKQKPAEEQELLPWLLSF